MNIRQTRLLIHCSSAALLSASAGVAYWGMAPIDESVDPPTEKSGSPSVVSPEEDSGEERSVTQNAHWQQRLRGPLVDPAPKPKPRPRPVVTAPAKPRPAPRPVAPKIALSLVGTILEHDRTVGVFSDPSGNVDMKPVGEVLDLQPEGIRVDAVDQTSATVSLAGQQTQLKMKVAGGKKGKGGKGKGNKGR